MSQSTTAVILTGDAMVEDAAASRHGGGIASDCVGYCVGHLKLEAQSAVINTRTRSVLGGGSTHVSAVCDMRKGAPCVAIAEYLQQVRVTNGTSLEGPGGCVGLRQASNPSGPFELQISRSGSVDNTENAAIDIDAGADVSDSRAVRASDGADLIPLFPAVASYGTDTVDEVFGEMEAIIQGSGDSTGSRVTPTQRRSAYVPTGSLPGPATSAQEQAQFAA